MTEGDKIRVNALSFGTIFKVIFWSGLCFWAAVFAISLLAALVAPAAVTVNGQQAQTTAQALGILPIVAVLGAVVSASGAAIGGGLLKIAARVLPLGDVRLSK